MGGDAQRVGGPPQHLGAVLEQHPRLGRRLRVRDDGKRGHVSGPRPASRSVLGTFTLAPFDAADISSIYTDQTNSFKTTIRSIMQQNFERFNVIIQTSDDPLPPAGVEYTSLHFGGFNSSAFGMAENVDLYNADFCDDAIIFTESFAPRHDGAVYRVWGPHRR